MSLVEVVVILAEVRISGAMALEDAHRNALTVSQYSIYYRFHYCRDRRRLKDIVEAGIFL